MRHFGARITAAATTGPNIGPRPDLVAPRDAKKSELARNFLEPPPAYRTLRHEPSIVTSQLCRPRDFRGAVVQNESEIGAQAILVAAKNNPGARPGCG